MLDDIAGRKIRHFDEQGRCHTIRYDELMIGMGESCKLSLVECLYEEKKRIEEFKKNAKYLSSILIDLEAIHGEIEKDLDSYTRSMNQRCSNINSLPSAKRLRALDDYYVIDRKHGKLLDKLTSYLLSGSEGDHSAHSVSLLRRALDYTCRVMRNKRRKTMQPAAVHAIEAAKGAAKNGLRVMTVIATLMHDVVEERLDDWTEKLIDQELQNPDYGEYAGKKMKDVPRELRYRIIQKHIDAYNDRASGIFFAIGLTLYDHIRRFPVPGRYYESLHSTMEMVAALSRRRDQSYYGYLRQLLYPKPDAERDTMSYQSLRQELLTDLPNTDELLQPYLVHIHSFYETELGSFSARDEVRRNAFREILAKILDRLNNTRDMAREAGFSIPARLYGTGFKNIFFLQAIEDKLRRPSFNTEERRAIEVKFLNKPKVAALYQILEDIEQFRRDGMGELIDFLDNEIVRYMATKNFWRLTPPGRGGYFNGLIYLFNDITLGRKSSLAELERNPEKIAEVLVAFRAVLESFLVYPALYPAEDGNRGRRRRVYRIRGMGPGLERHSRSNLHHEKLQLKTFSRVVIGAPDGSGQ